MPSKEEIIKALETFWNIKPAADSLGIGYSTLRKYIKDYGIEHNSRKKKGNAQDSKFDWKAIQKDHSDGMSERKLSKKYNVSLGSIHRAKKLGILIPREYNKKFLSYEQRRARMNEANARYRARKKNQTPEDADINSMQEFYENCPDGYEVDHIIPLSKGGLHTLENLQYLTISENRKKSNKV